MENIFAQFNREVSFDMLKDLCKHIKTGSSIPEGSKLVAGGCKPPVAGSSITHSILKGS
jgi:hypothetical protein